MSRIQLVERSDDKLDALYALPLGDFVAARRRLSDDLRRGGDVQQARLVKSLAKPTLSAWVTNQTIRRVPDLVRQLLAATHALGAAQRAVTRTAENQQRFQDARTEQRQLIARLVDVARSVMSERGNKAGGRTMENVERNLGWGPLSKDDLPRFERGSLIADVAPPGFSALAGTVVTDARQARVQKASVSGPLPSLAGGTSTAEDKQHATREHEQTRAAAAERRARALKAAEARADLRRAQVDTARARQVVERHQRARDQQRTRVQEAARALENENAALNAADAACLAAQQALAAREMAESEAEVEARRNP